MSTETDKRQIPPGPYCYEWIGDPSKGDMRIKPCPHWGRDKSRPAQENGFCRLLDIQDWSGEGLGLLWDQVKACDINLDESGD